MTARWLVLCLLAVSLTGCATPMQTLPALDRLGTPGRTWSAWLDGGPSLEAYNTFSAHASDPVGRFGAAEAAFALGQYEDAWDLHAEVVAQHPDHPLARWAALRLLELRTATPGVASRSAYLTSRLRQPPSQDAATSVLLALLVSGTQERAEPLSIWRTVGPYGSHPIGDLERAFPPDGWATLAREPAPSRTELAAVRNLRRDETDPSKIRLPTRGAGTYYAETEIETNRAGPWVLYLELPHDTHVLLDGVPIVDRDILSTSSPEQILVELELGAGRHRLRLRTAWTGARPYWKCHLVPLAAGLTADDLLQPGEAATTLEATSGGRVRDVANFLTALPVMAGIKEGRDPLATYLRAQWAVEFAPADTVDDAVKSLVEIAPDFTGTPLVEGRAAIRMGELGYLDPVAAQVRAVDAWRRGTARHPDSPALALAHARGLAQSGRWTNAVAVAERLITDRDDLPALLFLADAYGDRGWWDRATDTLVRAQDLAPLSCAVTSRWLAARAAMGDVADPDDDAIAELGPRCPAVQRLIAEAYPADPTGASPGELALIGLLRTDPYDARSRIELARQRWSTGRVDDALETLRSGTDADPWAVELQLTRADLLRSAGRSDEATEALDRALTATPGDIRLLRARAWLDGQLFMAEVREPVPDSVAFAPREASALVLDRRHVRIHRDGAATTLHHRVVAVASRSDAEVVGSVSLPDGAILLHVRTRKPSGREVDARALSENRLLLRALEPGDVAEIEYLVHTPPRAAGGRFWPIVHVFGDPRWTTERGVLSVELPATMVHDVFVSEACCNRMAKAVGDSDAILTWQVDDLALQRAEMDSPDASSWAPFVAITVGDEVEEHRRALSGLAALSTRPTRRILALIDTIRPENVAGEEAWARSVFNWVTRQVSRRSAALDVPASSVISTGAGSPAVLAVALLRAAGMRAEVALVRPEPAEALATPESFNVPVVRAIVDGEVVWLDPSLTYMPFAYLPPRLQGARAIVLRLAGDGNDVVTPVASADSERREIVETLVVREDGSIVGEARLELRGETAAVVREQLASKPGDPARRQVAETIAGAEFPGSRVTRFDLERTEERGVPLVVQFRFEQPFRGPRLPGPLRIRHRLAPQELVPRYGLGSRGTPLLIPRPRRSRARITVIPPRGWQVVPEAQSADVSTEFGRLKRTVEQRGGRVVVEDSFDMPAQVVPLDKLGAFRRFAAAVDASSELQLTLQPVP